MDKLTPCQVESPARAPLRGPPAPPSAPAPAARREPAVSDPAPGPRCRSEGRPRPRPPVTRGHCKSNRGNEADSAGTGLAASKIKVTTLACSQPARSSRLGRRRCGNGTTTGFAGPWEEGRATGLRPAGGGTGIVPYRCPPVFRPVNQALAGTWPGLTGRLWVTSGASGVARSVDVDTGDRAAT